MKKFFMIIVIISLLFACTKENASNGNGSENNLNLDETIASYEGEEGIEEINALLDAGINTQDSEGATPLYLASRMGYTDIVKALISHSTFSTYSIQSNAERQTYINIENNESWTPLLIASFGGHTEVV